VSQSLSPSAQDLRALVDRDGLVGRLEALVKTASVNPPGDEAEVAGLAAGYCEELGGEVAQPAAEPGRPSVIARWSGGPGPTVAYCSHLDVVPVGDPALWDVDPFGAVVRDGRMHGRGTSDAKGPVAAAIEAVAILRRAGVEPSGTLELELVADEEAMGFKGAGYLVAAGIIAPDVAIVGEPTGLKVVRAQRGACWLKVTTRGLAAHGSAPERGVSAIRHMAEIVARLEETLPDVTHPIVGGPSINVGTIHGGEKVNMVPALCVVEVDRRTVPGETEASVLESIEAAIDLARAKFPDIDAMVEFPFYARPFEVPEGARVVTEVARAVAEATEADAELAGFRGASDARFLAEAGAEVVVCGPGEIALAHTARESIDLDELERAAVAYALAFARLLSP
jgi:succinyl-diaminopimelate desuccinylase